MKRLLAVAAAVSMIVVAIVIRSAIDDGGDHQSTPKATGTIACITELAAQCRALTGGTVRVEDAAVTAKAIAAGTADIDAWITLDPWPAMTNELAKEQRVDTGTPLARTDLVIAMVAERAARLAPACGGAVDWKCLGDAIGKPWTDVGGQPEWGTVKAGIPAPTSAEGLLLLAHAASGYFGDAGFATNDFDDSFLVWKSKVTATPASFTTFIQQFPAAFSAVGTTRVETASGTGTRPVAVVDASPAARAVVVIARVQRHSVPGFTNPLKERLRDAGWSTDGVDAPTGLPDPGVLLALSGITG